MSDTFLPGSGFDTYESQDKVLVQMDGSRECAVAVRILQQQGFAVAGAAVRLAAEQAADAESAKKAAEALGIECIVLNAEALAGQDAAVLGEGGTPLFAALLTAADKLGMQYVATAHRARVETGADGVHTVCPPAGTGSNDSTILAALPQEVKTADAVCRSGLSCEKRIPENPQIFRNSNIKIMFPLNMARV